MDFKDLFEQLKQFKKRQEQQKHRGFNNYNILTTVLKKHDEVRLHSRMIASLLDPFGEHYQSTLFLDKFLEVLNVENFNINSENCSVYREYQNIDLYITDGEKHIIIENKIYARDQEKQIERYIEIINEENNDLKCNDILVIYLSINRDNPSEYSLGNLFIENSFLKRGEDEIALFRSIHYKNEVLKWLKVSQYEVQNITNLNEVFRQYIDVVKMINNQYKDKIMSLSDYIQENNEVYQLAVELEKELPKVREIIVNNFFDNIMFSFKKELGDEWKVEFRKENLSKKHKVIFKIYKNEWLTDKENDIVFGIIFDKENYYNICWGIVKNNKVDINNIVKKFDKELNRVKYKLETSEWWLHCEWLHKNNEIVDFVEYTQFNKDSEKEFIDRIMNLIKIFELDDNSGLITKMNDYLNTENQK